MLRATFAEQPSGERGRRQMSREDRLLVVRQADAAYAKDAISFKAHSFLTGWAFLVTYTFECVHDGCLRFDSMCCMQMPS